VSKTTHAQPGRLTGRFWRLLGASTEKNRTRSLAEVTASSEYDDEAAGLSDEKLRKASGLLKLDDLAESDDIPQFLAIARETAERTTDLRPFDVQLLGALRMLAGDVIEMATGEGKTLAGAIAAAGYALAGRHVHVVTINDYLARRDAEWMGPLLEAMGLTVGWITAESTSEDRRTAYGCDVTYASVNEIGFDVLRDQLVVRWIDAEVLRLLQARAAMLRAAGAANFFVNAGGDATLNEGDTFTRAGSFVDESAARRSWMWASNCHISSARSAQGAISSSGASGRTTGSLMCASASTMGIRSTGPRLRTTAAVTACERVRCRVADPLECVAVNVVDQTLTVRNAQRRVLLVRPCAVVVHRDAHAKADRLES